MPTVYDKRPEVVDVVAVPTDMDTKLEAYDEHEHIDIDHGFDPAVVKRLTRKIDLRLIPMLSIMYCITLIDRNNLSQARAANGMYMNTELGLDIGNRYSIVTLAFFPPYILFEIPSQIGLRKFGPRIWLSGAVMTWGIVMLCMGFVHSWGALAGLRVLLGTFEAFLFPGASYLISCWYPRKQMAVRNTFFYITSVCISGLSAILSYGLATLHGKQGKAGWRWIFILTGVLTVVIGIAGAIFLVDFPEQAKFITEDERRIVQARIERDRSDSVMDPLTLAKFGRYVVDLKLWVFTIFYLACTVSVYSFSYFLPTILESMGFTNVQSLLLVTPPYVFAAIPAIASAFVADHVRNARGLTIAAGCSMVILGTCLYSQLDVRFKAGRYVGVFLAVGGCNSIASLIMAWAQTSIRSQSKRGYTSALIVGSGGIGGIIASMVFQQKEASKGYPTGVYTSLAFNAASIIGCFGLQFWYRRQNRRADRGETVLENHENFRYHL